MSRIDVQTLVLAFENRISALEKNPPDKVSTAVVINLLEKAIEDEIKNHFREIIKKELEVRIQTEFSQMYESLVSGCVEDILLDAEFRDEMREAIYVKMLRGLNE